MSTAVTATVLCLWLMNGRDFWSTVTSNSSSCATGPLSCLSVCNVGVLWPNGWMGQDATWYGGRRQPRRQCVRWGPSPLLTEMGTAALFDRPTLFWHGRPSQQLVSSCCSYHCSVNPERPGDLKECFNVSLRMVDDTYVRFSLVYFERIIRCFPCQKWRCAKVN